MKKTKIIGTIGPASNNYQTLKKLVLAGLNVVRINLSHATREDMENIFNIVNKIREELNCSLPIMIDTRGPEIRVKTFKDGSVKLTRGQIFTFTGRDVEGTNEIVSFNIPEIVECIKPNQKILAVNGLITFKVLEVNGLDVKCKVLIPGVISNKKSLAIPGVKFTTPYLNDKDISDIEWGIKHGAEIIAASFVNCKEDVLELRALINKHNGKQMIVSKIESAFGIKNLDEIIEYSDGIMVARGDLGVELPISKLPELQKELEEEEKISEKSKEEGLLRNKVTEDEISKIVSRWTGIPVSKLMEGEKEKLIHLEEILHERVIGQEEAVTKVSEAIIRSRAGIQNPNRPIGSFLFLGPTGVGKTELAKSLAECLFDDEKNMIRIDMTEYMEKFSVSRLIGAPPGYVGYEEGGQLTEAVRRKPYAVVLFDEVEKAHPDVFNILLQVLDDGHITDSQGRTVDFKNTIIILTSNLGSPYLLDGIDEQGEIKEDAKITVGELLRKSFRPEFLNRLDEIVFYKPLTKQNITNIIDLILKDLNKRMAEKQLQCVVTESAKQLIIEQAYDPVYGARPLKRYVQRHVETLIAKKIIQEDLEPDTVLTVDVDDRNNLFVK